MAVKRKTREEREAALLRRQEDALANRGKRPGRKDILDLSRHDLDPVTWFSPKKDDNLIDIVPYIISTENHPDRNDKKGICVPGTDDYKLEVWVHYNIGPSSSKVVCLLNTFGRRCPICEEMLNNSSLDDKARDALKPKQRVYYNVIDLNSEAQKVQLWELSSPWGEDRIMQEVQYCKKGGEKICFFSLSSGKSVQIRGVEDSFEGKPFIEPSRYTFKDREPYDESILDETYPLDAMLDVLTAEEIEELRKWASSEESEPSSAQAAQEEAAPARSRVRRGPTFPTDTEKAPVDKEEGLGKECPQGHVFGTDHEKMDACVDGCTQEEYNSCAERKLELDKEELDKKAETPRHRRRGSE